MSEKPQPLPAHASAARLAEILLKIHDSHQQRLVGPKTSISERDVDAIREELMTALTKAQHERDILRQPPPIPQPAPPSVTAKPSPPPLIHSDESLQSARDKHRHRPTQVRDSIFACKKVLSSIFDPQHTHLRSGRTNIETLPMRFPPVVLTPRQERVLPMPTDTGPTSAFQPFAAAIHPPVGSFRRKCDERTLHMPYTVFTQPAKLPSMERAYSLGPPRVAGYM